MRKIEKYAKSKWILRYLFCCCFNLSNDDKISLQGQDGFWRPGLGQARVPERLIGVNPGLKLCSVFVFYIPMHCLGGTFFVIITVPRVKAQHFL